MCFEGVTREVEALEYEAYAEMASERLAAIGEQEAEHHGLCAVALVHRVGRVPLSEPSRMTTRPELPSAGVADMSSTRPHDAQVSMTRADLDNTMISR